MYFSILGVPDTITEKPQSPIDPSLLVPHAIELSPLYVALLAMFVTVMLAVTFYVIFKLPSNMVKTSKKIVNSTAEKAVPLVIKMQGKRNTKKLRLKLTEKTIIIMKVFLVIIPILLVFISPYIAMPDIDNVSAMVVAIGLAGFSFLYFAIQYILKIIYNIKSIE